MSTPPKKKFSSCPTGTIPLTGNFWEAFELRLMAWIAWTDRCFPSDFRSKVKEYAGVEGPGEKVHGRQSWTSAGACPDAEMPTRLTKTTLKQKTFRALQMRRPICESIEPSVDAASNAV